jgi:succinate dehydrogenase / fumarate reductase membrane anchor subunit
MSAGAKDWMRQRVSAVLLIPLSLWLLWAGATLAGADYDTTTRFFSAPLHAIAASLLAVIGLFHTQKGTQGIIEDYAPESLQTLLSLVSKAGCTIGAIVVLYTMARLTLGA